MPPKVLNRRDLGKRLPADSVYVGRPSDWGNPFPVEKFGRDEAIARYADWIQNEEWLLDRLEELRGKDLVCWCAPEPCHADILLELANE